MTAICPSLQATCTLPTRTIYFSQHLIDQAASPADQLVNTPDAGGSRDLSAAVLPRRVRLPHCERRTRAKQAAVESMPPGAPALPESAAAHLASAAPTPVAAPQQDTPMPPAATAVAGSGRGGESGRSRKRKQHEVGGGGTRDSNGSAGFEVHCGSLAGAQQHNLLQGGLGRAAMPWGMAADCRSCPDCP